VRERLAVNKQGSHKLHVERFSVKKLNEVDGKEKYHVEVFAALEDLGTKVEINSDWEKIGEYQTLSLGYCEFNEKLAAPV
jgi:hypothetical protein